MADTKRGREKQADTEERRQREREMREARSRADESEPINDLEDSRRADDGAPRECHRRGCEEPAAFVVLERYQEESGHGAVEAAAALCRAHTAEEGPTNLDAAYPEYVFRIDPIPEDE